MTLKEKIQLAKGEIFKLEINRGRKPKQVFTKGNCGNYVDAMKHVLESVSGISVKPLYTDGHVYCEIEEGDEFYVCDAEEIIGKENIVKKSKFIEDPFADEESIEYMRKSIRFDANVKTKSGFEKCFYDIWEIMYRRYGDNCFDMPGDLVNENAFKNNYSSIFLKRSLDTTNMSPAKAALAQASLGTQKNLLRAKMGSLSPICYEKKLHKENMANLDVWLETKPFENAGRV